MASDIPKQYEPATIEQPIYDRWLAAKAFAASPDERAQRYVIMMPLPNVTGALHMGHAMDNVMQDLLIRWHRMRGENTLWLPGTDHAGIATELMVDRQLASEGIAKRDLGREKFLERVWQWKEQHGGRIQQQMKRAGVSCDWQRERFTLDPGLSRAVRKVFVMLFHE